MEANTNGKVAHALNNALVAVQATKSAVRKEAESGFASDAAIKTYAIMLLEYDIEVIKSAIEDIKGE